MNLTATGKEEEMQKLISLSVCVVLSVVSALCFALPVQWAVNGHWYEYVNPPGDSNNTWDSSRALAQAMELHSTGIYGDLATVTSAGENAFILSIVPVVDTVWLGGYQDAGSTVTANWNWITGEAWSYVNWRSGEPNDAEGDENRVAMFTNDGTWNDANGNGTNARNYSYVAEWVVPEPGTFTTLIAGAFAFMCRKRS